MSRPARSAISNHPQGFNISPIKRASYLLLCFVLLTGTALAQKPAHPASEEQLALIARASEHERAELENPKPYRYQERLDWNWGSETRSVIETAEGRADRIVLFNDEPLSPEQQARQQHRLEKLLSDRDALKNELKDQKSETQRRIRIVRAFPKAFFFDYAGVEKGLLRFNFRPDPDFSPKDRETQMYRGMEGSVWIEPAQERIVRIEGILVKDVSFGWGIVGHLSKGGIYEITQTQLAPGKWRIAMLDVNLKGKMFLFNSFRFQRKETNSRFQPVSSELSLAEAMNELLSFPEQERPGKHQPLHKQNPHK
ncbi:MAG TPA: hypothetical protein VKU42_08200 [Candidatus Angelobacter sp.]|nr:hypothetical protein [Candidatus Angelobacter sp.]